MNSHFVNCGWVLNQMLVASVGSGLYANDKCIYVISILQNKSSYENMTRIPFVTVSNIRTFHILGLVVLIKMLCLCSAGPAACSFRILPLGGDLI